MELNFCLQSLHGFEKSSILNSNRGSLMNRIDRKFIFSIDKLPCVLKELKKDYCIAVVDEKLVYGYENLYYDTDQFELYYKHHQGKLNRYKMRVRNYIDSNIKFLEVKFKTNKGRTEKQRIIKVNRGFDFSKDEVDFLEKHIPIVVSQLQPKVSIDYNRISFVNKTSTERVTFDFMFKFSFSGNSVNLERLVIAELKQEKTSSSLFIEIMRSQAIYEHPISKYCIALALLNPNIKSNNFKQTLLKINKIEKV
jgi:hypothetical protein